MKYEVIYKSGRNEEHKKIIDAEKITIRAGYLYFVSGSDPNEVVHAIFQDWLRAVEVK